MTATTGWIDASVAAGKRGQASKVAGAEHRTFVQAFAKAAADGDGSVYILAEIPANAVLKDLLLNCAALAGATSADLGFYKSDNKGGYTDNAKGDGTSGGAVLMAAVDISAGKAQGAEQNGLAAVAIADLGKKVWELLGATVNNKEDSYLLGLRLNTAGGAAGALAIRGGYVQG